MPVTYSIYFIDERKIFYEIQWENVYISLQLLQKYYYRYSTQTSFRNIFFYYASQIGSDIQINLKTLTNLPAEEISQKRRKFLNFQLKT